MKIKLKGIFLILTFIWLAIYFHLNEIGRFYYSMPYPIDRYITYGWPKPLGVLGSETLNSESMPFGPFLDEYYIDDGRFNIEYCWLFNFLILLFGVIFLLAIYFSISINFKKRFYNISQLINKNIIRNDIFWFIIISFIWIFLYISLNFKGDFYIYFDGSHNQKVKAFGWPKPIKIISYNLSSDKNEIHMQNIKQYLTYEEHDSIDVSTTHFFNHALFLIILFLLYILNKLVFKVLLFYGERSKVHSLE